MTVEDQLLAGIADPATRSVYADWLEERGDPRADLVRIAHDVWNEPLDLLAVRRLFARRRELRGVGDPEWRRRITLPTIAELRRRIGILAGLGRAAEHEWKLSPPLTEAEVTALETGRLGVPLPAQYRRYLIELANGGAGPELGIHPIADAMDVWTPEPFQIPQFNEDGDEDPMTGVLGIGTGDYTTRYHLICVGPHAGEVWISTHNGWSPIRADGEWAGSMEEQQQTPHIECAQFLDWYASWLDETLWDIARETPDGDELFEHEPEQVTDINLRELKLTRVPDKLRRMTATTKLSFDNTPIAELPSWIAELRELVQLDISKTALRTLPDALCELPKLYWISCFGTKTLERLPERIGRLPLRYLNLQYCRLVELPASIGALEQMAELLVCNNRLSTLPASVGALRLATLDLRGNCITSLPAELARCGVTELSLMENGMKALPEAVGRLPELRSLRLDGNPDLDLPGACRILASAPKLERLSLSSMNLSALPDELALLPKLDTISVSWNPLENIDVIARMPGLGAEGLSSEMLDRWKELRGR